jgi:hypothetical protein
LGDITLLGPLRLALDNGDEVIGAEVLALRCGLEMLVDAFENPDASESRVFFERVGKIAARKLYINAAKAGWLDE